MIFKGIYYSTIITLPVSITRGGYLMTIQEIQRTLTEQTQLIDRAAEQLVNAPEDIKVRQEKIFQIVKEQLTSVASEIAKYADKF